MAEPRTIVLAAGGLDPTQVALGSSTSQAMVPVNGRPVIGWLLEELARHGIASAQVVVRAADASLQRFLSRPGVGGTQAHTVPVQDGGSIVHSLRAGLGDAPQEGPVRLLLGDTLVRDPLDAAEDFVYVGEVEDSRRWCLAQLGPDGAIAGYLDKHELEGGPHLALVGYYRFQDGAVLSQAVDETLAAGGRELSAVLRRYAARRPLAARKVTEWFDFGHIDNLADARRRLLQPRYFNSLEVNPILNTITKTSEETGKLRDELRWYLGLPDELKVLTPRVVGHREEQGRLSVTLEYYGYPTLAELWVYGELHPETWRSILRRVLLVQAELAKRPGGLPEGAARSMYVDKTIERIERWRRDEPALAELTLRESITLNGRRLRGLPAMLPALVQRAEELAASVKPAILHGDLCFSNVLFDPVAQIVRLIDPRGSFGAAGIWGDPRYDVAKLRHSVSGLYDLLVAGQFELRETADGFVGAIASTERQARVARTFDEQLVRAGWALPEIRFLEGLLFLSMPPLHRGVPQRQRYMFLRAIELLDGVLP